MKLHKAKLGAVVELSPLGIDRLRDTRNFVIGHISGIGHCSGGYFIAVKYMSVSNGYGVEDTFSSNLDHFQLVEDY